MLFNSTLFILLFLPLILAVYYGLAARRSWRLLALGTASINFLSVT